jgi:hypothetical protein
MQCVLSNQGLSKLHLFYIYKNRRNEVITKIQLLPVQFSKQENFKNSEISGIQRRQSNEPPPHPLQHVIAFSRNV